MPSTRSRWLCALTLLALLMPATIAHADPPKEDARPPLVESYLKSGDLKSGETALLDRLREQPGDQQARFGLGVLRMLRAIEHLGQNLHRYGAGPQRRVIGVPILRMPVPENKNPEKINYAAMRKIFQQFSDDLGKAESTLAPIEDSDVKLPLHFGLIRLDLDGDGKGGEGEELWRIYARLTRTRARDNVQDAERFVVTFDQGDVHWMRGYCRLLQTFCEVALAHDFEELFHRTAFLFFPKVDSKYSMLAGQASDFWESILDAIAFVHLINLPVKEPERMVQAHRHLKEVIEQSRLTWKAIQAETDDDHEWIPNAKQRSVIPGAQVSPAMIEGWHEFLAEAEQILEGRKLIPFWRGRSKLGVNLRRVFTEPRRFDLVLWIQGSAAVPYLEKGELTKRDTWLRFNRLFRGNFIGFAVWFN